MGVRGIPRRFRFPWRTWLDVRREVDDELDFHLAMRREALERQGLAAADARQQALDEFGDVRRARRSLKSQGWRAERQRRRRLMFEEIIRDVRFAYRSLAKRPGFTFVSILALALGIGVNAAIFSLMNLVVLRPTMLHDQHELVQLYSHDTEQPDQYRSFSYPAYRSIRGDNAVFDGILAQTVSIVGVREGETSRRVMAGTVSANFFDVLGVPPAQGRPFTAEEEAPGAAIPVAILTHGFWRRLGGGEVLGTQIWINGVSHTVVGVTPEGFTGTTALFSPEVWLPLGMNDSIGTMPGAGRSTRLLSDPENFALMVFGRLRDGLAIDAAAGHLEAVSASLREEFPKAMEHQEVTVQEIRRLGMSTSPATQDSVAVPMLLILAMSSAVLLIACLDLMNMFLARGESRRTEIAIRVALGGSRMRLLRQQLTEGLLLSLAGGVLGLLGAVWASKMLFRSFEQMLPLGMQLVLDPTPDVRVLGATFAFCVVATFLFGFWPAWTQTRGDVFGFLKDRTGDGSASPRRRHFIRHGLVVAQISLSMVLLVAAGLFARGAIEAEQATPGFDLDGSVLVELDPGLLGYDEARSRDLVGRVLDRLRSLPAVEAASPASIVPFGAVTSRGRVHALSSSSASSTANSTASDTETGAANDAANDAAIDAAKEENIQAHRYVVGDGYFASLGLEILRGRDFTRAETLTEDGTPVVIVDEPLARALWPDGDAIGQWLQPVANPPADPPPAAQVIGIVPGILHSFTDEEPPPHTYYPLGQRWVSNLHIHVRAARGAGLEDGELLRTLRDEIRAVDADLPVLTLRTMEEHRDASLFLWMVRVGGRIFTLFGVLALFLALIGVYGVKAFIVSRRMREIGLRLALGATPREVVGQMLRESARHTLVGLGVGLVLAFGMALLLSRMLYKVSAGDPLTFGVAIVVLGATALLATWIPVRRASRVQPAIVLREE